MSVISHNNKVVITPNGKALSFDTMIEQANEVTGASDKTLSGAVQSLIDGYGAAKEADVHFFDYDGTEVYSYSKTEFASLESMPPNPTHEGLTAQGWNWTLEEAQGYVAKYGKLYVGQMYITDDGKTRIYVHLTEDTLNPYLNICVNGSVDIDWGDGKAHTVVTGTSTEVNKLRQHNYNEPGDYVIQLLVTGSMVFKSLEDPDTEAMCLILSPTLEPTEDWDALELYTSTITKVEIGSGVKYIGYYAFESCTKMETISIPDAVDYIADGAFSDCYALLSATIPTAVTDIGEYAFGYCYSLSNVMLSPNYTNMISVGTFESCVRLLDVSIPESIYSIRDYAFGSCVLLRDIIIPEFVFSVYTGAFYGCASLENITIPESVDYIGGLAFADCNGVRSIEIPGVTLEDNYGEFFVGVRPLYVTYLPSVAEINEVSFRTINLMDIRFMSMEPPVINTDQLMNVMDFCVIHVPRGTLEAYKSATNYPDPEYNIYVEDEE